MSRPRTLTPEAIGLLRIVIRDARAEDWKRSGRQRKGSHRWVLQHGAGMVIITLHRGRLWASMFTRTYRTGGLEPLTITSAEQALDYLFVLRLVPVQVTTGYRLARMRERYAAMRRADITGGAA